MKSLPAVLISLAVCTTCLSAPPATKEEFVAAVRAAYEAKDAKAISKLTWWQGASDHDRQQQEQMVSLMVAQTGKIAGVTLEPLPPDFKPFQVAFGKRIEPTHPVAGLVRMELQPMTPGNQSNMSFPCTIVDGTYYLAGTKMTDLGWKGPQDKQLYFRVMGTGAGKAKIHLGYNASGVDLEYDPTGSSSIFIGQYIKEITVTSEDDNADLSVEFGEGTNPPIRKLPLKGKGQVHYAIPQE